MDPNQENAPQQADSSYDPLTASNQPQPSAASPQTPPSNSDMPLYVPEQKKDKGQRKRILIVLGVLLGILFISIIVAIVLSGNNTPQNEPTPTTSEQQGPQPADALEVEQTNDSINQDISSLNDQADFPATELDDASLGL